MAELVNVAKGKRAWQSSLSKWSKPDDAERALNDDGKRDYSFHTDLEDNPWWVVDLGGQYPIHSIVAGNRRKAEQKKSRTLTVEASRDGKVWTTIHSGRLYWQGDLVLPVGGNLLARYVRLSLMERHYLHLSKVEVLVKKAEFIVKSVRSDGLGCRLVALLNTVYLSKLLNTDYRFAWRDQISGLATDFSKDVTIGNANILGHSIEPASEIFAAEFVRDKFINAGMQESRLSGKRRITAEALHSPDLRNEPGALFTPLLGLSDLLDPDIAPNDAYGIPDVFESIPFSAKFKAAIQAAREVDLSPNTAVLHIRSGDIVFGPYRMHGRRFVNRAVSLPLAKLAVERLQQLNYDVMVFGEDIQSMEYLRDKYRIRLASDVVRPDESGNAQRAIFDIVLMSRAQEIWAGGSGFAAIATDISRVAKPFIIHKMFKPEEHAHAILDDLKANSHEYHPMQSAFGYWQLYCSAANFFEPDERVRLLEAAEAFDQTNPVYSFAKGSELFNNGDEQGAEHALQMMFASGWEGAVAAIAGQYGNKFHLGEFFHYLAPLAEQRLPYASIASAIVSNSQNGQAKAMSDLARALMENPQHERLREAIEALAA